MIKGTHDPLVMDGAVLNEYKFTNTSNNTMDILSEFHKFDPTPMNKLIYKYIMYSKQHNTIN